ncbi:MAG: ATP-binding protein [Pseudoxanthomonas sp.]
MNWIDVCLTVMAAACFTLASIHLLIWNRQRHEKAHLAFAVAGYSIAMIGIFESLLMHAGSTREYAALMRWAHVPIAVMALALVAFVRLHLRAGRPWLGNLAWGMRWLSLVPNFTTGVNVNFVEINELLRIQTLGGAHYIAPAGISNPWMATAQLSNYLMVAFFLDAALSAWRRRSDPAQARTMRICASIGLFVLAAGLWNLAVIVGGIRFPVAIMPAFTGVLLVMSYELGGDVLRAAQLAKALTASEVTLRHSEQRIEDAVQAAGFGLWEWDLVSGEVWLSPRASELLDVQGGEIFDRGQIRQRIDPSSLQALEAAMEPMLREGGEYLSEFRISHAHGHRWLVARGQGEFDAAGKPVFVRGVVVDITERKQAAIQRDELAHLSRVALLAELSGSLAHELNQPLTSILSNAQAAQRFMAHQPPNLAEVGESLANIVESDKRAGEVIRRLRAMLRKEPADFRRLDLNEVVHDVLRLIRSDLLNKSIGVRLDLQPDLPTIEGDHVQLQQVLLNLIVNGSDAMQEMEEHRVLSIRSGSAPDGAVTLSVSDRGSGIAEEDLERIFSPFVTSKTDGMGLGLAVCTTIIESHGGRLWASNNAEGGASVHFRLPGTD